MVYHMITASVRYNSRSLQVTITQLRDWIEQTEETLRNAEDCDSPNDERIDSLQSRLDALTEAADLLESIE